MAVLTSHRMGPRANPVWRIVGAAGRWQRARRRFAGPDWRPAARLAPIARAFSALVAPWGLTAWVGESGE
eukprot:5554205-Alexandrium_andersonii.AAC.1